MCNLTVSLLRPVHDLHSVRVAPAHPDLHVVLDAAAPELVVDLHCLIDGALVVQQALRLEDPVQRHEPHHHLGLTL